MEHNPTHHLGFMTINIRFILNKITNYYFNFIQKVSPQFHSEILSVHNVYVTKASFR